MGSIARCVPMASIAASAAHSSTSTERSQRWIAPQAPSISIARQSVPTAAMTAAPSIPAHKCSATAKNAAHSSAQSPAVCMPFSSADMTIRSGSSPFSLSLFIMPSPPSRSARHTAH